MIKKPLTKFIQALAAAWLVAMPLQQSSAGGPGVLPQAPLFLSTLVEPNIYFSLDDSGSMDMGPMMADDKGTLGILILDGLPVIGNTAPLSPFGTNLRFRGYYSPTFTNLYPRSDYYSIPAIVTPDVLPPANGTDPLWDTSWVVRNHIANPTYFNPAATYEPWPGLRSDGLPYPDVRDNPSLLKAAFEDPDVPAGETVNLITAHTFSEDGITTNDYWIPTYFIWPDAEGDGVIEATDKRIEVRLDPSNPADLDDLYNFANWFIYYRSRVLITKAVIGGAIENTDAARMGLRWFNAGHTTDMDTMRATTSKDGLQRDLYSFLLKTSTTPSRQSLWETGNYFMQTGASAPILPQADGGECQQNFNIVMTDGLWNDSYPTLAGDAVGNTDINGGKNDTIYDGDQNESNDGGNYADSVSNTLADIAMRNYENDLRGDLDDLVPTQAGVDENPAQHLVTYGVSFGAIGKLDPSTDNPLSIGFIWPTPIANDPTTIDDLWHASYNGRGKYVFANDPLELEEAIASAILNIAQRTGTAAAVAINSARLSTESVVYLAQFNSNRWQGDLLAFPIVDLNTGDLADTPKWEASARLNGRDFAANPRRIFTYNSDLATPDGVPFQWSKLSLAMQDDLKTNATGGVDSDATGTARLEYLRGNRRNESGGLFFRPRVSLLGDIVNSGPVFVGAPSLDWPDVAPFPTGASAYSEFKNGSAAGRRPMVYVGANDGMLHGFRDDTGDEVFAYVPSLFSSTAVGEGLHYLTESNYGHRFYVDQTPAISDVFISTGASKNWHTVLVGGLRGGGRGLYALDVTDPVLFLDEANADRVVMWEFTDPDLGYTYSEPFIALANNGKWVAIFGSGYNDLGSGEATLFIVDIEGGIDGDWTLGTDYWKISTKVGGNTTPADRNGLATPAIADIDGDGTVDRVYAGDLEGNMWAFDLSNSNPNFWEVAYGSASVPEPLFSTPAGQPITAKPVLAKHPTQPDSNSPSNFPNLMVFFGTGQYLVDADKASTGQQGYFGVWDQGDSGLLSTDLIQQTFDTTFTTGKVLSRNLVDYSTDHGWYFDFDETGERSVTASIARADIVFFNSFVPVDDPCSVGGFGFRYAVDMVTGGSPLEASFDVNEDGVIDAQDQISNGSTTSTLVAIRQEGYLPQPVFIEDLAFTAEDAVKVKALKDIPTGRFSWQELLL